MIYLSFYYCIAPANGIPAARKDSRLAGFSSLLEALTRASKGFPTIRIVIRVGISGDVNVEEDA